MENVSSTSNQSEKKEKISIQEHQYQFPYHHIPYFSSDGSAVRVRNMGWGFDYLACMIYAKKTIENFSPSSVLDVGCGDGILLGLLDRDIKNLVGVDLSERAIHFARLFFPDIEFRVQDVSMMSETFDVVASVETLEHIPDSEVLKFLRSIGDRTRQGGLIYICVPSINLPLYKKHYRHYDPSLLKKQIQEANLDVEILQLRFFRSPVFFEDTYKRLTHNRYLVAEFHPLRRILWHCILRNLEKSNPKTAEHVIAVLRKK